MARYPKVRPNVLAEVPSGLQERYDRCSNAVLLRGPRRSIVLFARERRVHACFPRLARAPSSRNSAWRAFSISRNALPSTFG